MSSLEKEVQELLAVIHRDGGHHTANVGVVQSIKDAETYVRDLRAAMSEFCQRVESCEVRSVYTYHSPLSEEVKERFTIVYCEK